MKKILLIGNGAREHVIAETLKRSPQGCELYVYMSAMNPGVLDNCHTFRIGKLDDMEAIKKFAVECKPDFAFIGPDNPIADGAADALLEVGIKTVAPLKICAQLESSKAFTRELVAKYGIEGSPKFRVFTTSNGLREFIKELGEYVVKADGLTGGKGVKVSANI